MSERDEKIARNAEWAACNPPTSMDIVVQSNGTLKKMGEGVSGVVYAAGDTADGMPTVVKKILRRIDQKVAAPHQRQSSMWDAKKEEYRITKAMGEAGIGPRVVGDLVDCSTLSPHPALWFRMERMGMDLHRWLGLLRPHQLPQSQKEAAREQLDGLIERMHTEGYAHNDLHWENIMGHWTADGWWEWKIMDFGAATTYNKAGENPRGHILGIGPDSMYAGKWKSAIKHSRFFGLQLVMGPNDKFSTKWLDHYFGRPSMWHGDEH